MTQPLRLSVWRGSASCSIVSAETRSARPTSQMTDAFSPAPGLPVASSSCPSRTP